MFQFSFYLIIFHIIRFITLSYFTTSPITYLSRSKLILCPLSQKNIKIYKQHLWDKKLKAQTEGNKNHISPHPPKKTMQPFFVSQILPYLKPSQKCGLQIQWHFTGENWIFPLLGGKSIANSFLLKNRSPHLFPPHIFLCWNLM